MFFAGVFLHVELLLRLMSCFQGKCIHHRSFEWINKMSISYLYNVILFVALNMFEHSKFHYLW